MSAAGRLRSTVRTYVDGHDPRPMLAMFALNTVDELDTAAFIWVAPAIAEAFDKDVGDFGLITVLTVVVAPIIAIPVSLLADRKSRMPIALAAAATWGLFSLGTGLSTAIWMLMLMRIGSSLGRTVSYPVQLSLLADFYPPRVRARALGVHAMANNAGSIFGAVAGGGLAAVFGWRSPFFLLAVPTLLTILWARRIAEPKRGAFEKVQSQRVPPIREVWPRLWAIRSLRFQWFAGIWFSGGLLGATIVLPFYFDDDFGIGTFGVGAIGSVAGLGAATATIIGSRIAQDQLNISPATGVRWIVKMAFAIVGLIALFALAPTVWIAVPILFVIMALSGLVAPLLATVGTMISPPELRSSAYSIGQLLALLGAFLIILVTQVAQQASNRWGLFIAAAVCLRGAFHLVTAARYVDADVERLDPAHTELEARVDDDGRVLLLETKDLTVSYDGVQVLFGVDIEIRQGEIVALLGTNGAGKSTTLNAISGLVEPDGGNVWFDGVPITGEAPERTAARGIVQAPGGRGIFPGLTVEENLRLGAFLLRRDKDLLSARLDEALHVFPALRALLPLRAGSLSGGQRQMLVLAQAFLLKPKLLLIDELSLGLAPVVVQELLATVRRLNDEGITVVLVEQSVNIALTLADRAYFMEKGQVRFHGPTADLLDRDDLLRSVFLGGGTPDTTLQPA